MTYNEQPYRVGDLLVNPGTREVHRGEQRLDVPNLSFRLFDVLAKSAPNVVSMDTLIEAVWRGAVVSPETVTQRVKLLRQSLGDDATNPQIIKAVRGEGYRLIAPVTPFSTERQRKNVAYRRIILSAALVLLLLVISSAVLWDHRRAVPETELSIAVLPFDDLSEFSDQGYLAEGVAEELLNRLSAVPELRVIARTSAFSLSSGGLSVHEIAERLDVDLILHGSVRRSDDALRIAVNLIDPATKRNAWSQTYDRKLTDIFEIQDDIAANVVKQMRVDVLAQATASTVDPFAYTLYLQARQLTNRNAREPALQAIPLLEQALEIEPEFVDAILELARARFISIAVTQVPPSEYPSVLQTITPLLDRATAIEPGNPRAIALQAYLDVNYRGQTQHGLALFDRALAIDPGNNDIARMAAITFVMKGLSERGIELWRGVLDRDPLCVVCHYSFVMAHVTVDKLESAAMSVEVLVSIAEGVRLSQALNLLGALRLLQGQPDEALRIFEDTRIYEPHRRLGVALALHDLGREADFERTFTELKSHWSTAETKWSEGIVTIYGWSGNLDQAFKLLDDDIESHNHASELYGGMWGPYFRNMRRDPRWQRSSERLAALRAEQATPPLTGSVQE